MYRVLLLSLVLVTGCVSTSPSDRPKVEAQPREYSFDHVPNVTEYSEQLRDSPDFQPQRLIGGFEPLVQRVKELAEVTPCPVRGRVSVIFVVDEGGNVVDPQAALGIHEVCDAVAEEAMEEAKFVPAQVDGQPIRLLVSLPITFD